ncbi:ATP-grasp domain-containing protein [Corynebacterium pacaense]|uniref:ATP-grasp domain-containing protein n=1 Tax=Corynebacterium pacaense TaxID=1816684 RepID=UPI0009B9C608|nr:ATP-grasp domain-containing protein [Corynebacterium pacaense]
MMNILLSSVGRRPYLVRWFREALAANGLTGRVIAADLDHLSPAQAFSDEFLVAPRVDDPSYRDWLGEVLKDNEISLAVSINDFELSEWAHLPYTAQWQPLVRVSPATQALVEDKLVMCGALEDAGITTPATWLGNGVPADLEPAGRFITKGRYGSASRGLRFTDGGNLEDAIASATLEVTTRQGNPALGQSAVPPESLVIVQEHIAGVEYGLDVVCDLEGGFACALARRKISMRAGETDRAESVDADAFTPIAERIAEAVPHPGTIDLDIIVDSTGEAFVIDINPRFGGGYPFSHLAGADVPGAYVAWAAGLTPGNEWLASRPGIISGKYVEAVRVS